MTIGVFVDGRIVQRPYSVASAPSDAGTDGYEMYLRLVQGGTFTPVLWDLPVGHRMRMIGPKGKFTLQPDDDRTHLFVSSGTGIAPFIAMMRQALIDGRPRRAVFLNGVSHVQDLGYRDIVEDWQSSGEYPVTFVPTISRPGDPPNAGWTGRTGRVETIVAPVIEELGLRPDETVAYLCGNPDMIQTTEATLLELRLPRGGCPQGAVLAQGQGAARRGRCRGRRGRRRRRVGARPSRDPSRTSMGTAFGGASRAFTVHRSRRSAGMAFATDPRPSAHPDALGARSGAGTTVRSDIRDEQDARQCPDRLAEPSADLRSSRGQRDVEDAGMGADLPPSAIRVR